MAVLLGENGLVELRRTGLDEAVRGVVTRSDVNYVKNRFSFNFVLGALLTGDQVELRTTDGGLLDFIAPSGWPTNTRYKDGTFYLYVDEVGAIRLYRTFDAAVAGETAGRVDLVDPGRSVSIELRVRNNSERILGQVIDFELNTERDATDVTALTDEFKRNVSGLISGSGRLQCFFDYDNRGCDPAACNTSSDSVEMPIYMNQLLLRTKIGSEFWGKLTLIRRGPKPYGRAEAVDDEIWYEFDARITNVGMVFSAKEPIRTTIEFVTTGEIKLRTRFTSAFMLQEQGVSDRIRLETAQGGFMTIEETG
jgi:hypothetical protein